MIRRRLSLLLLTAIASTGCQSQYRNFSQTLVSDLQGGRYDAAAQTASRRAAEKGALGESEAGEETVLYLLEAGRTGQLANAEQPTLQYLDHAQTLMRPYLDTKAEARVTEAIVTTALNQAMSDYLGTPSDRIMCSTLYGLELMGVGRYDDGRIALNLAADWQQDLKTRYEKEIATADRKLAKASDDKGISKSSRSQADAYLKEYFSNLDAYAGYADFANPFLAHVQGVYYLTAGRGIRDPNQIFRSAAALSPDAAELIAGDLEMISSGTPAGGTTWVYFMTGLAPWLKELRLDIPIPWGDVNYVSGAFPIMQFPDDFARTLTVEGGDQRRETVPLADLARIRASEFKAKLPQVILQELLSSTAKAAATYGAKEAGGGWGQLAGIIYQAATTSADTRSWRSLPNLIGVTRLPTPVDGRLRFSIDREVGSVDVSPGSDTIVMVSLPTSSTPTASIQVISLSPTSK